MYGQLCQVDFTARFHYLMDRSVLTFNFDQILRFAKPAVYLGQELCRFHAPEYVRFLQDTAGEVETETKKKKKVLNEQNYVRWNSRIIIT